MRLLGPPIGLLIALSVFERLCSRSFSVSRLSNCKASVRCWYPPPAPPLPGPPPPRLANSRSGVAYADGFSYGRRLGTELNPDLRPGTPLGPIDVAEAARLNAVLRLKAS